MIAYGKCGGSVSTEAEAGVMCPDSRNASSRSSCKGQETDYLNLWVDTQPCRHLDFGLVILISDMWPPDLCENKFVLIYTIQFVVRSHRRRIQVIREVPFHTVILEKKPNRGSEPQCSLEGCVLGGEVSKCPGRS